MTDPQPPLCGGRTAPVLALDEGTILSSRRTSRSTWTRLGLRALAVGLLLTGVAGGLYLGQDRQDRQDQAARTAAARAADQQLLANLEAQRRESSERSARAEAERKAAVAARNAAEQGRKAQQAVAKKTTTTTEKGSSGGPKPYTGPIPASCNEYSGARKTGCALMVADGFAISEFPCLDKLWTRESGWNYKAYNSSSGAGGIPQALPMSKMAEAGSDYKTNPATQITWGLGYIKGRYGTPCKAWAHSESTGWY